jgi:phage shock protein PspC (stress-responsive transcriptional regulator)
MAAVADRLYRSREDRMLAGVAAGVAESLDADPSIVRVAWVILTFLTGGLALVVYIVMAIVVPEAPARGYPSSGPWNVRVAPGAGAGPGASAGSAASARPAATQAPAPNPDDTTAGFAAPPTGGNSPTGPSGSSFNRASVDPGRGGLLAGLALIVLGGFFLIREFVPWFDWRLWWPLGLIGLGVLLLVFALRPGRPPG